MNTKFTPGPWRIGDAGLTVFGPPNGSPSPVTIARIPVNALALYRANARLIAAAPELYAALLGLLSESNNRTKAGDAARAALAKVND